jgi:hypothetical protein
MSRVKREPASLINIHADVPPGAERIPSVNEIRQLHRHVERIAETCMTPRRYRDAVDNGWLLEDLLNIRFMTRSDNCYDPRTKSSKTLCWSIFMSRVLTKLHRVSWVILKRSGWAQWPREAIARSPLDVKEDE